MSGATVARCARLAGLAGHASAVALALTTVCTVMLLLTGSSGAALAARLALVIFVALEAVRLDRGGRIALTACLLVALVVLFGPLPATLLDEALDRAAFFAALVTSLAFLRRAAAASPLLLQAGRVMRLQGARRRCLLIMLGSHLTSVIINFGVIHLFAPSLLKAGGTPRETRRAVLALLRGFTAMTLWSPLSLSFAVTMASLAHPPPWHQVVAAGLVTAGLVLALAMLSEIVATAGMTQVRSQAAGWGGVLLRVAGLAGLLIAACMATSWLLDTSLIVGVMLAAPLAAVAWRALQRRAAHEAPDPAWLPRAVFRDLPGYRDQVTVLGGASFIATVAAAVVTAEGVIGLAIHVPSQPVVLCALAACVVVAAGQVGIGPLITVSLLGPVLSLLPEPPPPLLAATALMGGWGVVVGATPVAAGTLSLAKLLEVRASRIAQHWNGRFSLVSLMLLGAWLGVLHMLLE